VTPRARRRFGEWPRERVVFSRASSPGGGDGGPEEPAETFFVVADDGAIATANDGAEAVWSNEP
jgi:hypothetical protein